MGRGVMGPGVRRDDDGGVSPGCRAVLLFAIQLTDDLIRVSRHHAVTEIS